MYILLSASTSGTILLWSSSSRRSPVRFQDKVTGYISPRILVLFYVRTVPPSSGDQGQGKKIEAMVRDGLYWGQTWVPNGDQRDLSRSSRRAIAASKAISAYSESHRVTSRSACWEFDCKWPIFRQSCLG